MIHYRDYIKPESLEAAYELNKKKSAVIAGGFCFLRMGNREIQTLVDLSDLLSHEIEEEEDIFRIGAMAALRDLELHEAFNLYTNHAAGDAVKHIVGTQFRNCATVGGSVFGRFGFSDVLTCFLAMDAYAELYRGGLVPLQEFATMEKDGDILTAIVVKKTNMKMAYESMRLTATDFPVLAVAVAEYGSQKTIVSVGARPMRAGQAVYKAALSEMSEERAGAVQELAGRFTYGTNMRGSGEYREYLAKVLIDRAADRIHALNIQDERQEPLQEAET